MEHEKNIEKNVLETIRSGRAAMRPKWHFILKAIAVALSAILAFLLLLYVAGLAIFLLRENGVWFAPAFGARGWFAFLRSLPWILIAIGVTFFIVFEILIRHYSFVYRKSILYSIFGFVALAFFGGVVLANHPLDRHIFVRPVPDPWNFHAFEHRLGPPIPRNIHRVEILGVVPGGFIVRHTITGATSTVFFDEQTRFPFGNELTPGDYIVVFGENASGTITAVGIREIER